MKGTAVYRVEVQTIDTAETSTYNSETEVLREVVEGVCYVTAKDPLHIYSLFGPGAVKSITKIGVGYTAKGGDK